MNETAISLASDESLKELMIVAKGDILSLRAFVNRKITMTLSLLMGNQGNKGKECLLKNCWMGERNLVDQTPVASRERKQKSQKNQ